MDFVNGRGGGRKSLKVLMVEFKVKVKLFLRDFDHISINIMLKINRERSERRKIREKLAFLGMKKHRSVAIRGGGAPGAPPLEPLVPNFLCILGKKNRI